jgi:cell division protein FtsB
MIWARLGVLLLVAGLSGYGGHKVTSQAWKAELLEQERRRAAEYVAEVDSLNARAAALEKTNAKLRADARTLQRWVAAIAAQPAYARECLGPDGLRAVDAALGRTPAGAGQPQDPLRGAPAAR